MLTAILAVCSFILIALVLKPLFSKTYVPYDPRDKKEIELEKLANQKTKLYGDIKDLDLEYRMGKMSESDYQSLRQQSLAEVSAVIRKLDALGHEVHGNGKVTDEYLEQLIHSKRKTIEVQHAVVCAVCNHENDAAARFCSQCGTQLTTD